MYLKSLSNAFCSLPAIIFTTVQPALFASATLLSIVAFGLTASQPIRPPINVISSILFLGIIICVEASSLFSKLIITKNFKKTNTLTGFNYKFLFLNVSNF